MKHDIVLAGVGGQGILTIARGLSLAALRKGLHVKQAEVHGMSQRGGAVYANVRISDEEIFSDILAAGQADMILGVEPMEALRYAPFLSEDGVIVSNTNAVANIANYPPVEQVLDVIARRPNHVLIDMERLARAAGSPLAANVVAIGAASLFLEFTAADLEGALCAMFESKGERIVEVNLKAFRFGRHAASAYIEALNRGASPRSIRQWIESLDAAALAQEELDVAPAVGAEDLTRLTAAESHAFEDILMGAYEEGRAQLYEHEVYRLIEIVGAISPPKHIFVPKGSLPTPESLAPFSGERVVLKLVSPDVVHKSDVQAVAFVPNDFESIRREMDQMIRRHAGSADVAGVLVVEFVETAHHGLGGELFVGIRATREFGPVIAAGLGGVETEFFASRMRPGQAVAKAVATETSAEEFLELFKSTAAYDLLAGHVRGHERAVSDGELIRCFRAFISIARRFCVDRGEEGPDIGELEVNPFAFRHQRLVPLDGLACLRTATHSRAERPRTRVANFLEPKSIAIVGVSASNENFGRIILQNTLRAGFDPKAITILHEREAEIDGVRCVPSLNHLDAPVDLFVIAAPSASVPGLIEQANKTCKVGAGIVISGGLGETEDSADLGRQLADAVGLGRSSDDGPVFLGPNCMGVQSYPGKYDTFFIPEAKVGPVRSGAPSPVAILSQSGAFVISRISHLSHLKPAFSITLGNQIDVTVSDLVAAISPRQDVDVIGIYLEGFADLDGAQLAHEVRHARAAGKTVVFYKGGRTDSGRKAAAGHTASIAGDYDICLAAMESAGALVAQDFQEFEHLLELATLLADKEAGTRVYAITNAGMEAVALADALTRGSRDSLDLPPSLGAQLDGILADHKLSGLVSPRNPMDLTPMANEGAYEAVALAALDHPEIDALIVSCVPLTPQLKTSPEEMVTGGSLAELVPEWARSTRKPIVFVIDAGGRYDPMADAIRAQGVPVFRTADVAGRVLLRYLASRPSRQEVDCPDPVPA